MNKFSHNVSRRAILLAGGVSVIFGGMASRLAYLQLFKGDYYSEKAEKNSLRILPIAPERALILDRNGEVMAGNLKNFRLDFIAKDVEIANETNKYQILEQTISQISALLKLSENEQKNILKKLKTQADFLPIIIKENLSYEEMQNILARKFQFEGLLIKDNIRRFYPSPFATAHVLGYVAKPNEKDVQANPMLKIPAIRTGRTGLESYINTAMIGTPGLEQAEVDVHGQFVRDLGSKPSLRAESVKTTLNLPTQKILYERLNAERAGAGIICDINNGEILAMASAPGFDANNFADKIDSDEWRELNENPLNPLTNKVFQGAFPPGSTIKPIVAFAALSNGILPSETHVCTGSMFLGDHEFRCWKHEGHGAMNLHDAIKHSCDIWFYQVSLKLGFDKIATHLNKFGLGVKTGFVDKSQNGGLIPNSAWKKQTLKEPWYPGENLINAIGQGFVLATPLQLVVMAAAIANKGFLITPHLVAQHFQPPQNINANPEFLQLIQQAMADVVKSGTAAGAKITDESFEMAGKTGTAQVRSLSADLRAKLKKSPQLIEWELQDHALFIGYAPVNAPKYAAAILVEHGGASGGGGSKVAAPIARDALYSLKNV